MMSVRDKKIGELDLLWLYKLFEILQEILVLIPVSSFDKYSILSTAQNVTVRTAESEPAWVMAWQVDYCIS